MKATALRAACALALCTWGGLAAATPVFFFAQDADPGHVNTNHKVATNSRAENALLQ